MKEEIKKEIIGKAGFPFYVDYWEKYFLKMNGDQIKEVLDIVFNFNKTCEIKQAQDLAVEMVVTTIIDNIKRDAEKRLKQSKASKKNGRKGGRPKLYKEILANNKAIDNENKDIKEKKELQFSEFWEEYKPIHTNKGSKEKAKNLFIKSLKDNSCEKILNGLKKYMKHCHSGKVYTKQAEVWLKNKGWLDEYETKNQEVNNQSESLEIYRNYKV